MKNNLFGKILEIIWLMVGLAGVYAAVDSFRRQDTRNGWIMVLIGLVGFLMYFARRTLRLRRDKQD